MIKFPQLGHTGRMQIEGADVIIVNKIDLVDADQLDAIMQNIRELNENAVFVKAINGRIPLGFISGIRTRKPRASIKEIKEPVPHSPEEKSFVYRSDKKINLDKFKEFANSLPTEIYRSKGFLNADNGYLFDYVNGRWNLKEYVRNKTELVFIGKEIDAAKEKVIERLKTCEID